MSSKTTTSGAPLLLQQLAERPGDLLGGGARLSRPAASGSPLRPPRREVHVELLQNLDHGPVGDPVAVGRTAAARRPRLERGKSSTISRDLPTPASPTTVTSSQHARRARAPTRPAGARARAPGRRTASRPAAPARRTASSRYAGTGSALPFSPSGSTGSTSTAPRTSESVSAR